MTSSSSTAATNTAQATQQKDKLVLTEPPKTTGEKYFGVFKFITGEGVVIGLTAALAYIGSYGKDKYGPIPNYLKQFTKGLEDILLNNKYLPLAEKGDVGKRLAGAISSTMLTFHGGNLYTPVYKYIQDKKPELVTYFNKHFGKPGEVEAGKERLKFQTKENWWDVIKGRAASFGIVFTSFMSADLLLGKGKNGKYHFDSYVDGFGKAFAKLTKNGKAVAEIPEELAKNDAFRFGKILSLDIYATTAALAIWGAISKISAMSRGRKAREAAEKREAFNAGIETEKAREGASNTAPGNATKHLAAEALLQSSLTGGTAAEHPEQEIQEGSKASHTARMGERPADYRELADKDTGAALSLQ